MQFFSYDCGDMKIANLPTYSLIKSWVMEAERNSFKSGLYLYSYLRLIAQCSYDL